ncbi:hypothetical protein [Nocardia arizonensis]|uniref:hypothetical protein n=1 Tax=Nocardia arizonensis TaxID=1141647 RepID=UPI0006D21F73|nr:hypothetical protein [Nocardia arizonensis]
MTERAWILAAIVGGIAALLLLLWLAGLVSSLILEVFRRVPFLGWLYWLAVPTLLVVAFIAWQWIPLAIGLSMPILAIVVGGAGTSYDESTGRVRGSHSRRRHWGQNR